MQRLVMTLLRQTQCECEAIQIIDTLPHLASLRCRTTIWLLSD
jgi:hypothetical protein